MVDFEPHRHAELRALAQHRLHRGEEVLGVVGQLEVGVARDAERVVREHLHPREQRVEMRGDDLFERDEARAPGQRDEAGEQRRDLDAGESLLAGRRMAHRDGEVEREVGDVRERDARGRRRGG